MSFFDESNDKRKAMFKFFEMQGLVQVLSVLDGEESEQVQGDAALNEGVDRGFFDLAIKSTKEDWQVRGDNLFERDPPLYSIAAECYKKSGDFVKERLATGHYLHSLAKKNDTQPHLKMDYLMQASEALLDASAYDKAATCLFNAKQYLMAAELFSLCGEAERAAKSYIRLGSSCKSKDDQSKWRGEAAKAYRDGGFLDKALVLFDKAELYAECAQLFESYPDWQPSGSFTREHFTLMRIRAAAAKNDHAEAVSSICGIADSEKRLRLAYEYADKYGDQGELYVDLVTKELSQDGRIAEVNSLSVSLYSH